MKKYRKGEPIKSLEEMLEQEFVMFNDKVYHKAWMKQWHIGLAEEWIKMGMLYKVAPIGRTVMDDFFEKYPNALLCKNGLPSLCPYNLDKTYKSDCDERWGNCAKCWSQPAKKA